MYSHSSLTLGIFFLIFNTNILPPEWEHLLITLFMAVFLVKTNQCLWPFLLSYVFKFSCHSCLLPPVLTVTFFQSGSRLDWNLVQKKYNLHLKHMSFYMTFSFIITKITSPPPVVNLWTTAAFHLLNSNVACLFCILC